ncbi:MAG: hydroxymethylglutaryl-CoA synthase [Pseudomonadota bacterium]
MNIGISGLATYVPAYRVNLEQWCDWTGQHWPKMREVVGDSFRMRGQRHSVYTMAATAVMRLIRQYDIDPAEVRFLGLGTESSLDNSAGAVIVKGMIDTALAADGKAPLSRACEVPEFKHACLGGVYAMKSAVRALALDGRGSKAIVVCADIAEYQRDSSGEPTQGAGAVAMLLEENPTLAVVDLVNSGSASDYRVMDFRKPMLRFCGQDRSQTHQVQDFPVFNGKYSTTCYVDETLHALDDMYARRGIAPAAHLSSVPHIFMHRPYRRMPENGLSVAWFWALAQGGDSEHERLRTYAEAAGIEFTELLAELRDEHDVSSLADAEHLNDDTMPLTMGLVRTFRATEDFDNEVHGKLSLGSECMRDLGNLYTAALPAWMAAGFEEALEKDLQLTGQEILTLGYGSGDAAEVIPMYVAEGWREATRKMRFREALENPIDLTQSQYEALHDGRYIDDLPMSATDEFFVAGVGRAIDRQFQDLGIEYYEYQRQA